MRSSLAMALVLLAPVVPRAQAQQVSGSIEALGFGPDSSLTVRLKLQVERGWHISAQRPGSSGLPTTVSWTLPEGWAVSDLRWPVPVSRAAGSDTLFIYQGRFQIDASLVTSRPLRPRRIRAVVSFGACRDDICVPGQLLLALIL